MVGLALNQIKPNAWIHTMPQSYMYQLIVHANEIIVQGFKDQTSPGGLNPWVPCYKFFSRYDEGTFQNFSFYLLRYLVSVALI